MSAPPVAHHADIPELEVAEGDIAFRRMELIAFGSGSETSLTFVPRAHCHSLEEELFLVLSGTGTLTLGVETHPLIAGDAVFYPAAGKVWIRGLDVWLDSAAPPPGSA